MLTTSLQRVLLKAIVGIGLVTAAYGSTFASMPKHAEVTASPEKVGGIIIKYRSVDTNLASERSRIDAVIRRAGIQARYHRAMSGNSHVVALSQPVDVHAAKGIAGKIARDPSVLYAEPDYVLQPLAAPSDPLYEDQWHYHEPTGGINLAAAWKKSTGAGVVVAVIDTGYRPHADLAANLLSGYDFISESANAFDGNGTRDSDASDPGDGISQVTIDLWLENPQIYPPPCPAPYINIAKDSSWHGTHVAGTIAAVTDNAAGVAGVAFEAAILPVRVLGRCGGLTSDIVDGMRWAAGLSVPNVPNNANPAQVLNLSLGGAGTCSQPFADAIEDILDRDATIVVAAGNANADASNTQPANCAGVITIAATNRGGGKAYYSNFGSSIELAAPGGEVVDEEVETPGDGILSTLNTGTLGPADDSFEYYQGTSMAAPHVAGAVALLYSLGEGVGPEMTPDLAASILQDTARPFPATCNSCGAGIVDAFAAVSKIYDTWALRRLLPAILVSLEE